MSMSFDLGMLGGSGGSSLDISDMSATWNDSGTTFTAIKMDVTDTASSASSLLMDLQVGGTSKFKVSKLGTVIGPASIYSLDASFGVITAGANTGGFRIGVSQDIRIERDAADTLALRRTTNAQTFNIYNTYTDGSNYERGFLRWNANTFEIGASSAGTGLARNVSVYAGSTGSLFLSGGSGSNSIRIYSNSVERWRFTNAGHIVAASDNSFDIGADGATRPRNGYFGGTLQFGTHTALGVESVTGYITITDAGGTTRKLAVVS